MEMDTGKVRSLHPIPAFALTASCFLSCQSEQIFLPPLHFFHIPVYCTIYTTNISVQLYNKFEGQKRT